ncbi:putative Tyrosine-protein phosphatase [Venustampulla echinocandica]|uniref:Putative Tyrosine-protein phosphatase n=1 Tax=Venustampulla echinocandica TaxID=2656787 RepID=A0A370U1N2_9HELO|nr:putative Tyrosine-protein phosphatase [Venustampulla echinocandica]RDL41653.1 putative Tyrosine-protein phosphatase [Venustampulla echinocandica]
MAALAEQAQPSSQKPNEKGREFQPPFVPIDGLNNFRDIGGWPISSPSRPNSKVRSGILYRGPDLGPITDRGAQQMKDIGVEVIFDIRSVPQIVRAGGVKELEGIQRVWCPVFQESDYTPEKAGARYTQYSSEGTDGIVQAFEDILANGATTAFRPILLHLASLPNAPRPPAAMIHCTTGNNRSGVFVGTLLSLLGVPTSSITAEYALSEIGLRAGRDEVVERLMKNPKFRDSIGDGEQGRRRAMRMVGAREESMRAMLEMLQRRWGGAEGYMRDSVGLHDEEIERVKKVLTT